MNLEEFKIRLSEYAVAKEPFVFVLDFECKKPIVYKFDEAAQNGVYFDIKGITNAQQTNIKGKIELLNFPIKKDTFIKSFNSIQTELKNGNTYLLNLTFPSEIETNLSLKEIFHKSNAPYKLLYKDLFVVFSPECFIKINKDEIYTYPMKGTIDAEIKNAESILLNNEKEKWEHNTIVDLMRNDISMVASNIRVKKYRYIDKIKTHNGAIFQTSSEIVGTLPNNWKHTLGESILKLLPAGSISGAPKKKTLEIIKKNEITPRGYYTGVFGIFDGENLISAVSIRFIEQRDGKKYFRSGGGITAMSKAEEEYNELIQKIYIPNKEEYPLFETICIKDGSLLNIQWHQKRYEYSYQLFYGIKPTLQILENIVIHDKYKTGIIKLRLSYNKYSKKTEFEQYTIKSIETLKIVYDDTIDYSLKYTNRENLNVLLSRKGCCDDILIVKKGKITESSYTTIVFYDGTNWVTPSSPLLKGTARERLIQSGIIKEQDICIEDLNKYKSFKLINAMRDFDSVPETDIKNIAG